ncbi:MAG: hypothetical protein M3496_11235, partial [Pseudomonadota bacterium]|nr:hypothetical protein [Pseudomonadota bacterium]
DPLFVNTVSCDGTIDVLRRSNCGDQLGFREPNAEPAGNDKLDDVWRPTLRHDCSPSLLGTLLRFVD